METTEQRNARLRKVASAAYARMSAKFEADAVRQETEFGSPKLAAALRQHSEAFARMSARAAR